MENTEELLMEMINRWKADNEEIERTFGEYGKAKVMRCKNGVGQVENKLECVSNQSTLSGVLHATHEYI